MKESTEIEEKLPDKKHEDAVLKYLAENHPDDENALSEMTALLDGATDSQALLDAVYRGCIHFGDRGWFVGWWGGWGGGTTVPSRSVARK